MSKGSHSISHFNPRKLYAYFFFILGIFIRLSLKNVSDKNKLKVNDPIMYQHYRHFFKCGYVKKRLIFSSNYFVRELTLLCWTVWHEAVDFNFSKFTHLCSVQFSHSVVSDSLWPDGLKHARPPCPSPTPKVYLNPCPSSWWCHPTISSSVVPLSSCLWSFPASRSFQLSQLFTSGSQSIGVSVSTSVLPMNTQDWSPLGWTGWISLLAKRLSRIFSNTTVQKHQLSGAQLSL